MQCIVCCQYVILLIDCISVCSVSIAFPDSSFHSFPDFQILVSIAFPDVVSFSSFLAIVFFIVVAESSDHQDNLHQQKVCVLGPACNTCVSKLLYLPLVANAGMLHCPDCSCTPPSKSKFSSQQGCIIAFFNRRHLSFPH